MLEAFACAVVVLAGLYFLVLGGFSLLAPSRARAFLLGFAASKSAHYAELVVRFVTGAAFIVHSPRMLLSWAFNIFGWVVLVTTIGLLLVPWQWHRRFARQSVPRALRYLTVIGVASLGMGGAITAAVLLHGKLA